MPTKIITKNSSVAAAVPTAAVLELGELAVNVTDKRLFTENASGTVVELGTNPSTLNVTGTATFTSIQFDGLNPTVTYDFNDSGTVTSADALYYLRLGSGISTGVDISSTPVVAPNWSAATGSVYANNKFRILAAKGNATDAIAVATSSSALGYGDTVVIGNVDVNGSDTKLITGLGINGELITLAGNLTATGTLAVAGAATFSDAVTATGGVYLGGSAAANHLNDYEEGTWTGKLDGLLATATTGKYTKVGNLVTVSIYFNNVDTTGAAGAWTVEGLPFTVVGYTTGSVWSTRLTNETDSKVLVANTGYTTASIITGAGNNGTWASAGTGTYAMLTIQYMTS